MGEGGTAMMDGEDGSALVGEPDAEVAAEARPLLGRKAFLERAIERSGGKRRAEARASVEAALSTLADALAEGHDLNLPPLGRVRVTRDRDNGKARVLTVRLTLPKAGAALDPALADHPESV